MITPTSGGVGVPARVKARNRVETKRNPMLNQQANRTWSEQDI